MQDKKLSTVVNTKSCIIIEPHARNCSIIFDDKHREYIIFLQTKTEFKKRYISYVSTAKLNAESYDFELNLT